MKKLKLNLQNMEGAEVLTREQLKMVMGGDVGSGGNGTGANCTSECYGAWDPETNTKPILGFVDIPECNDTYRGACRSSYPDAHGASCGCS